MKNFFWNLQKSLKIQNLYFFKRLFYLTDHFRGFEIQLQLLTRISTLSLFSGLKYLKFMHNITGTLSISTFFCEKVDSLPKKTPANQPNKKPPIILVTCFNNSCNCLIFFFSYAYQRTKHTANTQC